LYRQLLFKIQPFKIFGMSKTKKFDHFIDKDINKMKKSNIYKFFNGIKPIIEIKEEECPSCKKDFCFKLKDLWNFYDEPYGFEIKLEFNSKGIIK
jgi:hypothetical protein